MAGYLVEEAAPGLYALAVWDESWGSYNNCYLLTDGDGAGGAILIDSGKAEHAAALLAALAGLGVARGQLRAVVATHGHRDHVGGATAPELAAVPRHVHAADSGLLPRNGADWRTDLPDGGTVLGMECVLLGQHTLGSVALYHPPTRALFWGDHVCFFGAPLDEDGLVGFGAARRERMLRGVAWRREHWPPDAAEQERIRADLAGRAPEDQRRHDFPLRVEGGARVLRFDVDVLCTGHGPVLRGAVTPFLTQLVAAARGQVPREGPHPPPA